MDNLNVKVSSSPHMRSKDTTSDIMFDVIIALVPATAFGVYKFGWYAALLVAVCIVSCVFFEAAYEYSIKKKITVGDFSAALTGLLIALNLPPELPVWMAIIGCLFAIVVVKQLFGGLGQNFMNPALAARCFLLLSFSKEMTKFVYDGVTQATPLSVIKSGHLDAVKLTDMFIGNIGGTIGETSTVALLIGAFYLLVKRIISPRIPLTYIGTFTIAIVTYAVVKDYDVLDYTLAHLCGGGLMLGAWFMATDYVTSPITPTGKIVFGVMLGLLTFVLRIYGSGAEGVSYAIIISNLFVPLIEKVTVPKSFGYGAETSKEAKKLAKAEAKAKAKEEAKTDIEKENNEKDSKEKFDFSAILKAVAALCIITLVMGAALGVVFDITKKPIEDAQEKAKTEAYKEVYPDAYTVSVISEDQLSYDDVNDVLKQLGYSNDRIDELAFALDKDNKLLGYIVLITNSEGYGGDIQIVVGISTSNVIQGVSFLTINETVGLGMEAKEEEFRNQFVGKEGVTEFLYTKNGKQNDSQIDALSGATITTSAVTNGVNGALNFITFLNMSLDLGGEQ